MNKMSKEQKIKEIDKLLKYYKEKLETTDNIAPINAKIVKWTMIKKKIQNNDLKV